MIDLGVDLFDVALRARVESVQWHLAQQLLQLGNTVIIEWGLWARSERDALRERARELGVAVELRYLDVPTDLLWERIRTRGMEQAAGSRAIEREDLVGWVAEFEAPNDEELALFDPPTV